MLCLSDGCVVSSEAITDSQYVFDVLFSNTFMFFQWLLAADSYQELFLIAMFLEIKKSSFYF